jgi:hypothetical protein
MAYPPKVLEVAAESADDDLLADVLGHLLGDHPRHDVRGTAGSEANQETDLLRRKRLGKNAARRTRQHQCHGDFQG